MTKSPISLAREAMAVGQEALPVYASRFSRKDFTLPQLFAILVLRKFFRTDYRGIVALLAEWSDVRRTLRLKKVPNFSTLWYAEQKLMHRGILSACWRQALGGLVNKGLSTRTMITRRRSMPRVWRRGTPRCTSAVAWV